MNKKGTSKETTQPAWEFFDLKEDPQELRNAFNDARYAPVITEMKTALIKERKKYLDTDASHATMNKILKEAGL